MPVRSFNRSLALAADPPLPNATPHGLLADSCIHKQHISWSRVPGQSRSRGGCRLRMRSVIVLHWPKMHWQLAAPPLPHTCPYIQCLDSLGWCVRNVCPGMCSASPSHTVQSNEESVTASLTVGISTLGAVDCHVATTTHPCHSTSRRG
jgi:hypothetical protein